jgi:hypothetical protein
VATDAVRETFSRLTVIGTTIPADGSDYVEVLLDVVGERRPRDYFGRVSQRVGTGVTVASSARLREQLSTEADVLVAGPFTSATQC